ncbi:MAG: M13 family metallopeptidase [Lachnospiraceae bacterium]|nr:M13 family metallopeptidase [Lachnospiraceae bacterium]
MKGTIKKGLALLLSVVTVFSSGCGAEDIAEVLDNSVWVDSDVIGTVSADKEVRLQDDFAAAANKEWKLDLGETSKDIFSEVTDEVYKKMEKVATDPNLKGPEADALRKYYALSSNWEERNADGVEPLKKYIDDIMSISDINGFYDFICDPERNPMAISPVIIPDAGIAHSMAYPEKYSVAICEPDYVFTDRSGDTSRYFNLDQSSLEAYEGLVEFSDYFLGRMGFDEKEAGNIRNNCLDLERSIITSNYCDPSKDQEEYTVNRAELLEAAGDYPLGRFLESWGYKDTDIFVTNINAIKKLDGICSEGNVEKLKSFLVMQYVYGCYSYLDKETIDKKDEISESRMKKTDPETEMTEEEEEHYRQFNQYINGGAMVGAMSKLYVDNCFDETSVSELTKLTEDIIAEFHEVFDEEEWLSDEGKKLAKEKLDAIGLHVVYQDFDSVDYNEMDIISHDEGGTFLDAVFETRRFMEAHKAEMSTKAYDRNYWDPLDVNFATTITNAMYNGETNGIYIFAGICEIPAYNKDLSYEEKLSGLGCIIGHEITHGFDKNGAMYDKDGNENSWLPEVDQSAFNDLNDKVGNYYSTKTPYPSSGIYDGARVNAEATADMGGLAVTLHMASKIPDFDYDKYFRNYARLWRVNISLDDEKGYFSSDVHPLSFYRINVGLQQFDEFVDTYGVKEGDGMYLAPEDRIKVW